MNVIMIVLVAVVSAAINQKKVLESPKTKIQMEKKSLALLVGMVE